MPARRLLALAAVTVAPACAGTGDDPDLAWTDPAAWPEVARLKLPVRRDAFATADTYLVTRGHIGYRCEPDTPAPERSCPLDINALRWDPATTDYTRSRTAPNVAAPTDFTDHVMWELPLVAPIDGQVIACWRGMPDDDVDGDDVNCPGGAGLCAQGGNHLIILTADGDILFFGHLRQDSIPPALCPIADTYLYATDGKTCTLGDGWSGLRDSSRFDLRGLPPVRVREGDFIGRVGASGSGEGIHLHMHVLAYAHDGDNPCVGPYVPMAFAAARLQIRSVGVAPDPDAWLPLDGDVLPIDGRDLLLAPD